MIMNQKYTQDTSCGFKINVLRVGQPHEDNITSFRSSRHLLHNHSGMKKARMKKISAQRASLSFQNSFP